MIVFFVIVAALCGLGYYFKEEVQRRPEYLSAEETVRGLLDQYLANSSSSESSSRTTITTEKTKTYKVEKDGEVIEEQTTTT